MVAWILKYTGCIFCEWKLIEVIVQHTNTVCTSLKRKYTKNEINTAQYSAKWHHNLTARSKSPCSNQPPWLLQKFPACYGSRRFMIATNCPYPQTRQSISCPALLLLGLILTSPSQICLHLPSGLSLGFPTKPLYIFPFCPKNAIYHTQLKLPDKLTWMTVGVRETNKFWVVRWDESFQSFTRVWQISSSPSPMNAKPLHSRGLIL